MFSRRLTRPIAIGAAALAVAGGAYGLRRRGNGHVRLGNISPSRFRQRGIQRSLWTGRRGIFRHRQKRVRVEFHRIDSHWSEGDRQKVVLYDIPEGDKLDLGECG